MSYLCVEIDNGVLRMAKNGAPTFEGYIDGRRVDAAQVLPNSGLAIVLLEPDVGWKPTENLLAVTAQGNVFWRAELPTYLGGDCYVAVNASGNEGLFANSWSGFRVWLNPSSGRILRKIETK